MIYDYREEKEEEEEDSLQFSTEFGFDELTFFDYFFLHRLDSRPRNWMCQVKGYS